MARGNTVVVVVIPLIDLIADVIEIVIPFSFVLLRLVARSALIPGRGRRWLASRRGGR